MDYLFIPGNDAAEVLGRLVISRRPNTVPITRPAAQNHLAGLLAHLTTLPASAGNPTPRPIGDILVVAHGLENGTYFIPLSRTLSSPTDFEKADDANTAASNPVRLTAALLTPAGGGGMNTITVRLRGCNIGKAEPLVRKLQEAMTPAGGTVNMIAPLHFDEFHGIVGGHVEYFAHKFTLKVKQQFLRPNRTPDRDALLAAFGGAGFTYLNGTAIPATAWQAWVPANIHPPQNQWRQAFDTPVELNPVIGTQRIVNVHREYRFETIPFSWDWRAPDPGNHPDRLDILRNTLPLGTVPPSGRHLYDPSYPWPLYERYGFTDINDFVDNLDWTVTFTGGVLHFRTRRFEYTVMLPITDPPAAATPPNPPPPPVLKLYNYFATAAGASVFNLPETNATLFLIL